MITETTRQSRRNRPHQIMPAHRFAVGELVRMRSNREMAISRGDAFRITALLPFSGELPQYRIRNDCELHERLITQDRLEPVVISENAHDNALLIAKTFGRG